MKIISTTPLLATRLGPDGYQVLSTPGPLANLLKQLSQVEGVINVEPTQYGPAAVIPLTAALNRALAELADNLICIRYDTNQVQLTLDLW